MRRLAATYALVVSIAIGLVLLTVAYRFLTMGGPLGGFENDQFVTLSQAQQMAMGDRPVRDFDDLGMPLTIALSAVGQVLLGHTLFAEVMVTTVLLGLCCAALFVLSWRASGSIAIALAVALVQIAMAPRFYNYPKLLAYAFAIPAIWWYIEHPDRRRLFLIAVAGVAAFLLRYDHGFYAGVAGILAVVVAQWPDAKSAVREVAVLGVFAAVLVSPYLAYVQYAGEGVIPHFTAFVHYASQSADMTTLRGVHFEIDRSQPLLTRVRPAPARPRVNVRWRENVAASARAEHEARLGLGSPEPKAVDVVNYALAEASPSALAAIVRDPLVADTQGIDRYAFTLNDVAYTAPPTFTQRAARYVESVRVLPAVLRAPNAVPFLYYLMYAASIAALCIVLVRGDRAAPAPWNHPAAKIAVVAVLALLTSRGFLRGNLPSRLADVSEVVGVLAAWVAAVIASRSTPHARAAAASVLLIVFVLTSLSVDALERVTSQIAQTGATTSLGSVRARTRDVYATLTATPPVAAWPASTPGMERLARYVNACTQPTDRVLTIGYMPELFFMAQRPFAGGNAWIRAGYFTSEAEQQLMITRMRAHRVPIVVAVPEPSFTEDYVESFPRLTATIGREYRSAGTVDFGRGFTYQVLVRRDLTPTGAYPFAGLPCYS